MKISQLILEGKKSEIRKRNHQLSIERNARISADVRRKKKEPSSNSPINSSGLNSEIKVTSSNNHVYNIPISKL